MNGADAAANAQRAIREGSKSFAAAARLFDPRTRRSAVLLYAWCRTCDDVVDGQMLGHGHIMREGSPTLRLERLEALTRRAYSGEPMTHPAFAGFQEVVKRHAIPLRDPLQHLAGFRMDATGRQYETLTDVLDYGYHVAGVVGVMMARIMGASDAATLDRASDLGVAFQLTNIARDVMDDAEIGRVYLPRRWLIEAGVEPDGITDAAYREGVAHVAERLLDAAEPYYLSAGHGLAALPFRSALAVATALGVYRAIGSAVRREGASAWDARAQTSAAAKWAYGVMGFARAVRSRAAPPAPRDRRPLSRPS